jgi:1-acyl-sn-glycerol-3-phosphate acyltransferase
MKAILFWPYQLYAWLIFLPLVIVLTLLFSMLTVIFATLINPEWASRVFAVTWGRVLAYLTPVSVTVEGAEKAGHIFIDRRDPKQAREAIREALDSLSRGVGILFFPEGTRSRDGRLLSFKKGAFRLAIDQGLPLLPVTLVGTRNVLPARSLRLFPGPIKMVIHPEIDSRGKTVEQLIEESRAAITTGMPPELR